MPPAKRIRDAREPLSVRGIVIRRDPDVYLTALPGPWLLTHSTPSLRIKNPKKGFQRLAKEIARTVLDTHRTFPNAITLATGETTFRLGDEGLQLPDTTRLLVVDGQHRLWAQQFSKVAGLYPSIIHMDRTDREMAELFLEINDNQRKVPSSLRWDLVRLVRSDDVSTTMTADIVYALATEKESPFFAVGIDLTGERRDVTIKQGSLAPEIRALIRRDLKVNDRDAEDYLNLLIRFFVAIRSLDPDGWGDPDSAFFKARVLRALIRVLADLLQITSITKLTTARLRTLFSRIDTSDLSSAAVRGVQGSTGVQDLYSKMRRQVGAR